MFNSSQHFFVKKPLSEISSDLSDITFKRSFELLFIFRSFLSKDDDCTPNPKTNNGIFNFESVLIRGLQSE